MNIEASGWLSKESNIEAVLKDGKPTGAFSKLDFEKPQGICWHYTSPLWSGFSTGRQICDLLFRQPVSASWHLLIDRTGNIFQCISFLKASWHVGKLGKIFIKDVLQEVSVNKALIGIELENHGRLLIRDNKAYTWPYFRASKPLSSNPADHILDPNLEVPIELAIKTPEGYFCSFTEEQVKSAAEITKVLQNTYEIDSKNLFYKHKDFDSIRKEDPGPLWIPLLKTKLE
jgi:N-acetyl-anhydromuramyl-L-alanine amidase AmpD